ncbi:MAG: GHKL domain-containing protein, partial [Lachnospiraceae bacterium]|nr:GHKL domain-containing protein [Lachnospiraceae bacterium]
TTFSIIFGGSIIIYYASEKSLLDIILALTGHTLLILLNHLLTVPLSLLGVSLVSIQSDYTILFHIVLIILSIVFLTIIKHVFICPRLTILSTCPTNLLQLFLTELLIGLSLLTFNFIYGESVGYPTEVLSMNGFIITILTLSAVLIFYGMYDILMKNHELSLQQAQAEIMQDYTNRMESFYEEIREFRHDYRNILVTMQDYIDNGDVEDLQKYFHDKILSDTDILSDDGFFLGKLHLIEDHAVKSLLYTKLITILNHKLSLTLELTEHIPVIPLDNLLLCRVLGILLDNAIEASMASESKMLHLAIVCTDTATTFVIANSTLPLAVPISQLSTQGFTTKENHSGLGLATVHKLLDPLPHVSLFTECQDNVFRQTLEIQKG